MKRLPRPEVVVMPEEAMRVAGRFSARVPGPDKFNLYGKRLAKISFAQLEAFGLLSASEIYLDRGYTRSAITKARLEKSCAHDDFGWRLKGEMVRDEKFWDSLIQTESPFLFILKGGPEAAICTLRALTDVAVYANHSPSLGESALLVCKEIINAFQNVVIIGVGIFRGEFYFFWAWACI